MWLAQAGGLEAPLLDLVDSHAFSGRDNEARRDAAELDPAPVEGNPFEFEGSPWSDAEDEEVHGTVDHGQPDRAIPFITPVSVQQPLLTIQLIMISFHRIDHVDHW